MWLLSLSNMFYWPMNLTLLHVRCRLELVHIILQFQLPRRFDTFYAQSIMKLAQTTINQTNWILQKSENKETKNYEEESKIFPTVFRMEMPQIDYVIIWESATVSLSVCVCVLCIKRPLWSVTWFSSIGLCMHFAWWTVSSLFHHWNCCDES